MSIAVAMLAFIACNGNKNNKLTQYGLVTVDSETHIYGQLHCAKADYIYLTHSAGTDSVLCNSEGFFSFKPNLTHPQYLKLKSHQHNLRLFIEPGQELSITANASNQQVPLSFEGSAAPANQYLAKKETFILKTEKAFGGLLALNQPEFTFKIDSLFYLQQSLLSQFVTNNADISEVFSKTETASLYYQNAARLYEYLLVNNRLKPDSAYFEFEIKLPQPDSAMLNDYDVLNGIKAQIEYYSMAWFTSKKKLEPYPHEKTLYKLAFIDSTYKNEAVKAGLFYRVITEYVHYFGYKNATGIFDYYTQHCPVLLQNEQLIQPYQYYMGLLQKAQAPAIIFEDADGNTVKLADFKNKYVYLNVWATWCQPCRQALPDFFELKSKFESSTLVFIALSVDDNRSKWASLLSTLDTDTGHYRCLYPEKFLTDYQIKNIPQYLLIAPDGRIAQMHAPAPGIAQQWFKSQDFLKPRP